MNLHLHRRKPTATTTKSRQACHGLPRQGCFSDLARPCQNLQEPPRLAQTAIQSVELSTKEALMVRAYDCMCKSRTISQSTPTLRTHLPKGVQ